MTATLTDRRCPSAPVPPGRPGAVSRIAGVALPPGFVDELVEALGAGFVITEPEQLATYDCDGLTRAAGLRRPPRLCGRGAVGAASLRPRRHSVRRSRRRYRPVRRRAARRRRGRRLARADEPHPRDRPRERARRRRAR